MSDSACIDALLTRGRILSMVNLCEFADKHGMTIYQLIENDHALAQMLLDRIAAARNPEWRYRLCHDLAQVVRVHARAKQTACDALLLQFPALVAPVMQAREELDIAESFLKEALSLDPETPAFMRLFREARAELMHCMQFEVRVIFAAVRAVLTDAQAEQIGQRMRALKDEYIEAEHMSSASLRADAGYYS